MEPKTKQIMAVASPIFPLLIASSISQVKRQRKSKTARLITQTIVIVQDFDDMIARYALSQSKKKKIRYYAIRGFPIQNQAKKSLFQSNRIEFNSINEKNNFDSKGSFLNTLARALRNERNINNRGLLLYDSHCLLFSVFVSRIMS